MKRIISVLLCLLLWIGLPACGQENPVETPTDTTTSEPGASSQVSTTHQQASSSTAAPSSQALSVSSTPATSWAGAQVSSLPSATASQAPSVSQTSQPDNDYEKIECVSTAGYQEIRVLPTGSKSHFVFSAPMEWKIQKSPQGFSVMKNGKQIGTITQGGQSSGQVVYEETCLDSGVNCTYQIRKTGAGQYNHSITYGFKDTSQNAITLCVPYRELDSQSVFEMTYFVGASCSVSRSNIGAMSIKDNRKKILILGNSFIATSQIGGILQQMCGQNTVIEAQARGYARVSTYTQDQALLTRIQSGEFSAVFMCGFGSSQEVTAFQTMVNTCRSSNTQVAIFPAHNEGRDFITQAQETYPDVLLVDWKDEIDQLIAGGISKGEFCVEDAHRHSTPLAGYVGAHMIYRALFGKVPSQTTLSQVPRAQIQLLGNYVNTGCTNASGKDAYSIYQF